MNEGGREVRGKGEEAEVGKEVGRRRATASFVLSRNRAKMEKGLERLLLYLSIGIQWSSEKIGRMISL